MIAAAKKESAVTIINPLFSDRTSQRMGPAFIKRYGLGPDFKFNNLRKGTGATVSQVRSLLASLDRSTCLARSDRPGPGNAPIETRPETLYK